MTVRRKRKRYEGNGTKEMEGDGTKGTWSTVVSRPMQHKHKQRQVSAPDEESLSKDQAEGIANKSDVGHKKGLSKYMQGAQGSQRNRGDARSRKQRPTHNRMQVKGARRIWGTIKATTPVAVKATIKQFSTVGASLVVKRKYKTASEDPQRVIRWWFVLRGEEESLETLQGEWPRIATQTAWKLEPLYSYASDAAATLHSYEQSEPQIVATHLQQPASQQTQPHSGMCLSPGRASHSAHTTPVSGVDRTPEANNDITSDENVATQVESNNVPMSVTGESTFLGDH